MDIIGLDDLLHSPRPAGVWGGGRRRQSAGHNWPGALAFSGWRPSGRRRRLAPMAGGGLVVVSGAQLVLARLAVGVARQIGRAIVWPGRHRKRPAGRAASRPQAAPGARSTVAPARATRPRNSDTSEAARGLATSGRGRGSPQEARAEVCARGGDTPKGAPSGSTSGSRLARHRARPAKRLGGGRGPTICTLTQFAVAQLEHA